MEELIATAGWKLLKEAAEAQTKARSNAVLLTPTENPYDQEYKKGEIQGIQTFLSIPDALITSAKDILALEPEDENVDQD